ncbi:response regulator transcription factor [Actinocorallia lasiicapitis]
MTIRILLADDHAMFRSGLRAALHTQPDLECVAEVADGRAAVTQTALLRPDVAVLDIRMPKLDGLAAARAILAAPGNTTRVLLLTTYDLDDYVHQALSTGTNGFVLKSSPPEELLTAVRAAARGDTTLDPLTTRRLADRITAALRMPPPPRELARLTAREHQVLLLIAEARTNPEIAEALAIGEETVKTHVSRILAKLSLRDRIQAAVYAHRHNLVP